MRREEAIQVAEFGLILALRRGLARERSPHKYLIQHRFLSNREGKISGSFRARTFCNAP